MSQPLATSACPYAEPRQRLQLARPFEQRRVGRCVREGRRRAFDPAPTPTWSTIGPDMGTLLLTLCLAAVAWLLLWMVIAERTHGKSVQAWPFGYMADDDPRRRHANEPPF